MFFILPSFPRSAISLPREGGGPPLVVEGARRAALVRIPYGYVIVLLAFSFSRLRRQLPPGGSHWEGARRAA